MQKQRKLFSMLLVVFMIFAGLAPGTVTGVYAAGRQVYVSPAGNDANSGTQANPWKTLRQACDNTMAGDTINLTAGTFVITETCFLKEGVNLVGAGKNQTLITVDDTSDYFKNPYQNVTRNGMFTSSFKNGGWVRYRDVHLSTGMGKAIFRMNVKTAPAEGVRLELREGSPSGALLGSLHPVQTGGSQGELQQMALTGASGIKTLYLVCTGGALDVDIQRITLTNEGAAGSASDVTLSTPDYGTSLLRLWSDTVGTDGSQSLSGFTMNGQVPVSAFAPHGRSFEGIYARGRQNIKVHDVVFKNFEDHALRIHACSVVDGQNGPPASMHGIEIYNNEFYDCSGRGTAQDTGGGSSGCLEIGGLTGALIHHNTIRNAADGVAYGMKFCSKGHLYGCQIYNNHIEVNWRTGDPFVMEFWCMYKDNRIYNNYLVNGWVSLVWSEKGNDGGTHSVVFDHNYLTYDAENSFGSGIEANANDAEYCYNIIERCHTGLIAWGDVQNVDIHHNFIGFPGGESSPYADTGNGLHFEQTMKNFNIYNNIFRNYNSGVEMATDKAENITVKNNIFDNVRYAVKGDAANGNVFDHNASNASVSNVLGNATETSTVPFIHESELGLNFSGNRPDPYYRAVSTNSILHDAGTNVGFAYEGAAPDIGPVEWGSGTWSIGDGTPVVSPLPPRGSPLKLKAYFADVQSGVTINRDSVSDCGGGDYLVFRGYDIDNAFNTANGTGFCVVTLASENTSPDNKIEIRLDGVNGTLVSTLVPRSTGGMAAYEAQSAAVSLQGLTGKRDIYVVFKGGNSFVNLKTLKFTNTTEAVDQFISVNESYGISYDQGNIVGVDTGDWLKFNTVDFDTGYQSFVACIAVDNGNAGKQAEIRLDSQTGPLVATFTFKGTGGWGSFAEQAVSIAGVKGIHDVYMVFSGGNGIGNFKYFRLTNGAVALPDIHLGAEANSASSGIVWEGNTAGGCDDGDWLQFSNVDLGTGYRYFIANCAVDGGGKQVEVRLDSVTGPLAGTINTTSTGGWSTYADLYTTLTSANDVHTIYIIFKGGGGVGNFKSFTFTNTNPAPIVQPSTRTITIGPMANGTVSANVQTAAAGDTVALNVVPDSGYMLEEGSLKANGAAISGTSFVMPDEDVFITANFVAGPPPVVTSIAFDGVDTGTQGTWKGVYGQDGYLIVGDAASLPGYATVSFSSPSIWTWNEGTGDVRAVQKADPATDRVAACRYDYGAETIDMTISSASAKPVAIYFLDWQNQGFQVIVDAIDLDTDQVVDSRTITDFGGGKYLTYQVKGNVRFRLFCLSQQACFSAIFFGERN